MPNTTLEAEATREELVAEWVTRDAAALVQNRVRMILEGEDQDVLEKLSDRLDSLVSDPRCDYLFSALWPEDEDTESPEHVRASGEACYMAARILRSIVYHAEHLRGEAQGLFEMADKFGRQAKAVSDDA